MGCLIVETSGESRNSLFYFKIYNTVKSVYKGYSREPENVAFMRSCPLYTG